MKSAGNLWRSERLQAARRSAHLGEPPSQRDIFRLAAEFQSLDRVEADDELFPVVRNDGEFTGAVAPRWLCHLLGVTHAAAHVGLITSVGLVVLQRRSPTVSAWPGAWDMAAAGHVCTEDGVGEQAYLRAAERELEEELGLASRLYCVYLIGGCLGKIGSPYLVRDAMEVGGLPLINSEVRQVFGATLTAHGLSSLLPSASEVSSILLAPPIEVMRLIGAGDVASGLEHSGPRFLEWAAAQQL